MKIPWPWPESTLMAGEWAGVRSLLARFRELAGKRALPGSLMVLGEPGLGREGFVVELAALLTCREDGPPGCRCHSCDRVRRGIHPDVAVLRQEGPGNAIKIDTIRDDLLNSLDLLPFEGARRVFLVASLHTPPLTAEAASALLKAFEEPPEHAVIVGLAANPARALGTITSRAVQVRVPPPSREELLALVEAHHGASRAAAEALLMACSDDLGAVLGDDAAGRGEVLAGLADIAGELLRGEGAAAGELAAAVGSGEESVWLAVAALLTETATAPLAEDQEFLLDACAGLLAGERRRAALRLDPEAVALASLAPLLLENHRPGHKP